MTNARATDSAIALIADRLEHAAAELRPIAPIRIDIGEADIATAYAIQQELVDRRVSRGAQIVGRKIGLTSPAVQQQLGVDQPDFGVLFDDMDFSDAAQIPSATLLQPKAEAEVAFVLKADLATSIDYETVSAAVDYAVAALEIVDSRIANWDLRITDTVADNASSGLFVLGKQRLHLSEFTPRDVAMRMYADGVEVSHGKGADCLGDPLESLVWLARTAAAYGSPLRGGQVVLSGALGPMVAAPPGTRIRAEIAPLGEITATFAPLELS
jgi:2-keto-4-pentenoate hydratase